MRSAVSRSSTTDAAGRFRERNPVYAQTCDFHHRRPRARCGRYAGRLAVFPLRLGYDLSGERLAPDGNLSSGQPGPERPRGAQLEHHAHVAALPAGRGERRARLGFREHHSGGKGLHQLLFYVPQRRIPDRGRKNRLPRPQGVTHQRHSGGTQRGGHLGRSGPAGDHGLRRAHAEGLLSGL